ncbi:hypothetical protein BCR42DRAFT_420266 [Absidia repens]|uniref:BRCT domain-containing protein n=1 Tax=Absidia repens TaxID=90262 RepID=A0A1X2I9B8_9FUNG|nr:hypothetical protein BCR42DRAFT_420266 [Absidia repens]
MPVNSSSPTPSRPSLPNTSLRRRLVNRTPDKEPTSPPPPFPLFQINPTLTITKAPSEAHIPATPLPPTTLKTTQRASSPAAFNETGQGAIDCLKGVVAYLDIRTEDGADVSANFEEDLKKMGAKIRKTFAASVTHLIYKNGSAFNIKKAIFNKNCKIVNLLWVTNCKVNGKYLPEDKYLIDHPENLLLSATKRRKCMEPGQVKTLMLDRPPDTSACKRLASIDCPSRQSTKRSKLLSNKQSLSADIKGQKPTLHRKVSAIISKESTSSHHNKAIDKSEPQEQGDMNSNDDMKNYGSGALDSQQHQQGSTIGGEDESMMNKESGMISKPRSQMDSNTKYNSPDHHLPQISQRPQVNQEIKAGFYIGDRSSSSKSKVLPPRSLRTTSSTLTIAEPMKSPTFIRRRQRALHSQTSIVASTSSNSSATIMPCSSSTPTTPTPSSIAPPSQLPQGVNTSICPNNDATPTIVLTGMTLKQKKKCAKIIENLGKYQLAPTVDKTTTHVIVECQRRTLSVILGLLHGVWMVTTDWLLDSDKSSKYLDEIKYEATYFFPRATAARRHDPLLPSNISIYIHSSSLINDLACQLIVKCGGQTVTRLEEADIVVSNSPLECTTITVTDDWILDSIEQWQYLATSKYSPLSV